MPITLEKHPMNFPAKILASALIFWANGHAHAAQITDLQVVKNNLKAGLWSLQVEPYKVKGKYVTQPPSSGCVTASQIVAQLGLPLSYNTRTKEETPEAPTVITKDFADHGAVEVTIPGIQGLASSGPTKRTLDIKKIDKDNFVFIAGPGNLTTTRARYLGKCTP
jgi:hypothetical protein